MDLSSAVMSREEATKVKLGYSKNLDRATEYDKRLIELANAVLSKKTVISLNRAMQASWEPYWTHRTPPLAFARASATWCYVDCTNQKTTFSWEAPSPDLDSVRQLTEEIEVTERRLLRKQTHKEIRRKEFTAESESISFNDCGRDTTHSWGVTAKSLIPIVPLSHRPTDISNYHILFEPHWQNVRVVYPNPPDPALLKHITADLYEVVYTWDVTPIEWAALTEATISSNEGPRDNRIRGSVGF